MERPSGLGRSLEDVLDSLTPTESDPSSPGRVLFEPEDIEQQLDSLMGEIRDLRERVQHLVALVPGDPDTKVDAGGPKGAKPKKGKHKAKKSGKQAKKLGKGAKKAGKARRAKVGAKARPQRAAA